MRAFQTAVETNLSSDVVLPLALVQACATTLPIDGASITLTGQLRIPLAASNPDTEQAESLQITVGEGPCLTAAASDTASISGLLEMSNTWPVFTHELVKTTPYRSIASIPLGDHPTSFAALDLYSTRDEPDHLLKSRYDLVEAATYVTQYLTDGLGTSPVAGPSLLDSPAAVGRMRVWAAQGILVSHARISGSDALAALRGYAYGHNLSLDETAAQVTDKQLHASDVLS